MASSLAKIDEKTLLQLFISFNVMTKLRIVLYDSKFQEIISYPHNDCKFCSLLHLNSELNERCIANNRDAFVNARKTNGLYIYRCHAGLIEACYQLQDDKGVILGYLMIGQVSDMATPHDTDIALLKYLNQNNIHIDDYNNLLSTPNKTIEEIKAAAHILEVCALYLNLKNTIEYNQNTFIENLNNYIETHLKDNLSIDVLLDEFKMNKNALYNAFNEYSNVGIAEYIKQVRLNKAKYYLKTTDYSVKKIAKEVGFMDYNYFCRVFKKEVKMSAKKYRLSN